MSADERYVVTRPADEWDVPDGEDELRLVTEHVFENVSDARRVAIQTGNLGARVWRLEPVAGE